MIISRISPFTGATNVMDIPITQEQLDAYNCGDTAIQVMFPHLTPEQREFIMTGITEDEWPYEEDFRGREV